MLYVLGSLWGTAALLVFVELVTRTGLIPTRVLPPPSVVVATLLTESGQPSFWLALIETVLGWGYSLAIAIACAIPLGVLLGTNELLYRATRPIVEFLRPVPSVALVPLTFLLFTPGVEGKMFLATYGAFWPLLVQTIYGIRAINPVQRETARSFQISRKDVFVHVMLPASVPYIATGLRISCTVALLLAVTAEIVIGSPGIGVEINRAREGGDTPLMFAYLVLAGLLGLVLNLLFMWFEKRALHWHASQRGKNQ